ncbi:MAG: response regulator [Eubacteriales bacterium]|nr:response regulator [Eubacteriales bacterium]
MHLAVCDDHIADRKQMERLLGRESDRRISTTGVLYIDSFGSENSILTTPMIYDAIFMDMNENGCDAVKIANQLRQNGTAIPIIFCCGKVDYRRSQSLPDNILFLDKPVQTAELSAVIDQLLVKIQERTKRIEFRNMSETFYLTEEQLVYAHPQNDRHMILHLLNGEQQIAEASHKNFCAALSGYDNYISLMNRNVVNMRYIKTISFFKVTLTSGDSIRLSFGESRLLQKAVDAYIKENSGQ